MRLAGERGKANKLNAESQDTLNEFKGVGNLADQASQRERATQQKANHSKTRGAAKEGRNAIKGAAMDSLNSAKEFNNIRRHAQSGDVKAVARDAATAALKNAARQGVLFLISNPIFWGVVLAFLLLMFIIYLLLGGSQDNGKNPLVITKTGPLESKKGDQLKYSIVVDYSGTAKSAVITDPLPTGTEYVSSIPPTKVIDGVVTWDAPTLKGFLSNPIAITVNVILKATKDNTNIGNVASVTLTGAVLNSAAITAGNITATNNNCHGIYTAYMASVQSVLPRLKIPGANYGDPTCQLAKQDPNGNWIIDKDKILAYLKDSNGGHLSDQEAQAVFICILPNESSYNADAFNPNSTSAGSSGTPGAFGLFQMNAKGFSNTGQPEDVGDVVWSLQITNAISWKNKYNHGTWSNYWPQSYQGCLSHYGQ